MRTIVSFFAMSILIMPVFLSCNKSSKAYVISQAQSTKEDFHASNTDNNNASDGENFTVARCKWAYSADLAFISDPIFALHFVTDMTAKYHEFYAMALRRNSDAHMIVMGEQKASELFESSVETLPEIVKQNFKPLSRIQMSTALRARKLVFSPLMRLFAPMHTQYIETYRKKCNLSPARTLHSSSVEKKNTINVRYTKAIPKLASVIAAYMQEKNLQDMVAILDTSHMQNIKNMTLLVTEIEKLVDNFNPTLQWHKRTPDSENITFEQLNEISEDAVILLYAGMYTTKASHHLREQQAVNIERIFAIIDWEHISYKGEHTESLGIYASAWVAIPLATIFENKNYVNAKLYRWL